MFDLAGFHPDAVETPRADDDDIGVDTIRRALFSYRRSVDRRSRLCRHVHAIGW